MPPYYNHQPSIHQGPDPYLQIHRNPELTLILKALFLQYGRDGWLPNLVSVAGRTMAPGDLFRHLESTLSPARYPYPDVLYYNAFANQQDLYVRQYLFRAMCTDPEKADREWDQLMQTGFLMSFRSGETAVSNGVSELTRRLIAIQMERKASSNMVRLSTYGSEMTGPSTAPATNWPGDRAPTPGMTGPVDGTSTLRTTEPPASAEESAPVDSTPTPCMSESPASRDMGEWEML